MTAVLNRYRLLGLKSVLSKDLLDRLCRFGGGREGPLKGPLMKEKDTWSSRKVHIVSLPGWSAEDSGIPPWSCLAYRSLASCACPQFVVVHAATISGTVLH